MSFCWPPPPISVCLICVYLKYIRLSFIVLSVLSFFSHIKFFIMFFVVLSGIQMKFKQQLYPVLVAATHVKELTSVELLDSGIKLGASVTLTKLESTLKDAISSLPGEQHRCFESETESKCLHKKGEKTRERMH